MDPKTTKPKGKEETAEVTKQEKQKFLVEKLRKDSLRLFGITTSTFDGAFHGKEEKEYSIDEAKAIIDVFLYGKEGK